MYVKTQNLINKENRAVNIILLSLHMLFPKEEENVVYCQFSLFVRLAASSKPAVLGRNGKLGSYGLYPATEEDLDFSEVCFCVRSII